MEQIIGGLWHWTARHDNIGATVSSYYLEPERVLIDAMVPPQGLSWLEEHGPPEHVILSNRHHDRQAWRLRDAFGCTVHCVRNGMHELGGRGEAEPFDFGDELPGAITAYEVGAICPDEGALHLVNYRALACGDGLVRWRGGEDVQFVPDSLMDDPEGTKQRLREAYRRLLGLDFEHLLLAHGNPVVRGGKEALRVFIDRAH